MPALCARGSASLVKDWQDFGNLQFLPRQEFRESMQFTKYLSVRGKLPAFALIGENDFIIDGDLIDAIVALDQFGLHAELFRDHSRQTGGAAEKPSFHAVGNPNPYRVSTFGFSLLHALLLFLSL